MFCALAAQGRRAGDAALTCWWSERRCAALWGDLARPDGYGQWTEHAPAGPAVTDFFLEYDTGSENLHRVAAKLAGYRDLAARTGITTPVLFWLPTARREAGLRALLASTAGSGPGARTAGAIPGVPVATTTPEAAAGGAGPAGAIWLPAGQPGPRLRLAQAGGTTPAPLPATPRASRPMTAPRPAPACPGIPPPLRHRPCPAVPARTPGGSAMTDRTTAAARIIAALAVARPHRRVRRLHAAPARTRAAGGGHQASALLPGPGPAQAQRRPGPGWPRCCRPARPGSRPPRAWPPGSPPPTPPGPITSRPPPGSPGCAPSPPASSTPPSPRPPGPPGSSPSATTAARRLPGP